MRRGPGATPARRQLALAALLATLLSGCTSVVRSGLSEREADAMVLALDDHAIAGTKERGRGSGVFELHVARGEVTEALRVLRAAGELQADQPSFAEVYGDVPLVPTPSEEQSRHAFAIAGELARSIEQLDGVTHARVHLSPPEPRLALDAPAGTWRASIIVQSRAGHAPIDEASLRELLRGAVTPLPADRIAILQAQVGAPRRAEWARIGPFTVSKRDAPRLRAAFGGALLLNGLLALMLIVIVARKRRAA